MSRREKIILTIMALVIVGAGLFYLQPTPSGRKPGADGNEAKTRQELNDMVVKTTMELAKSALSPAEARAIARAEAPWTRGDLFLNRPPADKAKEDMESPELPPLADQLIYSGFVQIGKKQLAIINGLEYKVGDVLEPGDFTLREITPTRVVVELTGGLEHSSALSQRARTIVVPLAE